MAIGEHIARVDHLARLILAELAEFHRGDGLAERVLVLRCELNEALCGLYRFAQVNGGSFDHDRRKSKFCQSVDALSCLFSNATNRWVEKIQHLDLDERVKWTRSIETSLDRCILDIRCQLRTEQLVLSTGHPDDRPVDPVRKLRSV